MQPTALVMCGVMRALGAQVLSSVQRSHGCRTRNRSRDATLYSSKVAYWNGGQFRLAALPGTESEHAHRHSRGFLYEFLWLDTRIPARWQSNIWLMIATLEFEKRPGRGSGWPRKGRRAPPIESVTRVPSEAQDSVIAWRVVLRRDWRGMDLALFRDRSRVRPVGAARAQATPRRTAPASEELSFQENSHETRYLSQLRR